MKRVTKYSPETRERAVRLVWETEAEHGSQWAAIVSISGKVGLHGRDAAEVGPPG